MATNVNRGNKRQFTFVATIYVCCHKYGINRKSWQQTYIMVTHDNCQNTKIRSHHLLEDEDTVNYNIYTYTYIIPPSNKTINHFNKPLAAVTSHS